MKQQILLCLLVATIVFTGCDKKDTPTPTPTPITPPTPPPIDPSAFVGKWVGQVMLDLVDVPIIRFIDTQIFAINPNKSTQLINTYYHNTNRDKIIRTAVDSMNYTVVNFTDSSTVNGLAVLTTSNVKGVLINRTTLRETGTITTKLIGPNIITNSTYEVTYTKQ